MDWRTIQRYIAAEKIPVPPLERVGGGRFRIWTDGDIDKVRKILPTIANGRKTRYKKKHSVVSSRQSAKAKKKPQARAPAVHKKNKNKRKK